MKPQDLGVHRIFYEEDPRLVTDIPKHVSHLQGALLDFDWILSDRFGFDEVEDIRELDWDTAFRDRDAREEERNAVSNLIDRYHEMRVRASSCHDDDEAESEWHDFYRKSFLGALAAQVEVCNSDVRRMSRLKFYYDSFRCTYDKIWTLFSKGGDMRPEKCCLSAPKPDFVAYFPIYDFKPPKRVWAYQRWQWQNNPREVLVRNFSLQTLIHLARNGLKPSTNNIFKKGGQRVVDKPKLMCYPWLIVEQKKNGDGKTTEICYCQGANAANAALRMYQILAKYAPDKTDDRHVPPIAVITTVGKVVRVWIAYVRTKDQVEEYHMNCIWKGDTMNLIDVMKLEAIIENLHTWAMRELRPWISSYIDQWLCKHPFHHPITRNPSDESTSTADSETSLVQLGDDDDSSEVESNISMASLRDMIQSEHNGLLEKISFLFRESPNQTPLSSRYQPSTPRGTATPSMSSNSNFSPPVFSPPVFSPPVFGPPGVGAAASAERLRNIREPGRILSTWPTGLEDLGEGSPTAKRGIVSPPNQPNGSAPGVLPAQRRGRPAFLNRPAYDSSNFRFPMGSSEAEFQVPSRDPTPCPRERTTRSVSTQTDEAFLCKKCTERKPDVANQPQEAITGPSDGQDGLRNIFTFRSDFVPPRRSDEPPSRNTRPDQLSKLGTRTIETPSSIKQVANSSFSRTKSDVDVVPNDHSSTLDQSRAGPDADGSAGITGDESVEETISPPPSTQIRYIYLRRNTEPANIGQGGEADKLSVVLKKSRQSTDNELSQEEEKLCWTAGYMKKRICVRLPQQENPKTIYGWLKLERQEVLSNRS